MPKKIITKPINILEIKGKKKRPELFIDGKPIENKEEFKKSFKLIKGRLPLLNPRITGNIPESWVRD